MNERVVISVAPTGAGESTVVIDPITCEGCGVCVHCCPESTIDFPEKCRGEWFISEDAVWGNKSDINPEAAERIARRCPEREMEFVGHIRYAKEVSQAMVARQVVAHFSDGAVTDAIRSIWRNVLGALERVTHAWAG